MGVDRMHIFRYIKRLKWYKYIVSKIMEIFDSIYTYFKEIIENLNLEKKQKTKLIELLLLVGSILVAFKSQPEALGWIFMFFIFSSIVYYIFIQKDDFKPNIRNNLIPLMIAVTFSTILNANLFLSLGKSVVSLSLTFITFLYVVLYAVYYLFLSFVIWAALVKL